jgi:hypothetical protein
MQNMSNHHEQQDGLSEPFVIINSDDVLESVGTNDSTESNATIHIPLVPDTMNQIALPNDLHQVSKPSKFNFLNTCLLSFSISSLIILMRTILKPEPKYEQSYLQMIGITGSIMGLSLFAKYRFNRDSSAESNNQRPHYQ